MLTVAFSFGWVNASYVYALQLVNAHMKRALGAITDWETFRKMTEGEYDNPDVDAIHRPATQSNERRKSIEETHKNAKFSAGNQTGGRADDMDVSVDDAKAHDAHETAEMELPTKTTSVPSTFDNKNGTLHHALENVHIS